MKITHLEKWHLPNNFNSIPFGVHVTGDSTKMIVITWTNNILTTFTFNEPGKMFNNDSTPHKVNIINVSPDELIVGVLTTPPTTLFYTDAGYLNVFTSNKAVRQLKDVQWVKCIIGGTSGLIVVRHDEGSKFYVEIYPYTAIINNLTTINNVHRFDLTLEALDSLTGKRNDEMYSLASFKFDQNSKDLLESIMGAPIDEETKSLIEIILISIDSTLYWLKYNTNDSIDFSLIPLVTTVSKIKHNFYSKGRKFILLVLESGLVEIIYYSDKFGFIRRKYHSVDSRINWIEFISDHILIYANDERINQISFIPRKDDAEIKITSKEYKVEGVVSFSYNSVAKKLICITRNRLFFAIDLHLTDQLLSLESTAAFYLKIDQEVERSYSNFVKKLKIETENLARIKDEIERHKKLTSVYGCLTWQDHIKANTDVKISVSNIDTDSDDRVTVAYDLIVIFNECLQGFISQMRIGVQVENFIDCSVQQYIWNIDKQPFVKTIKYILGDRPLLPRFKISCLFTIDSFDDSICFEIILVQHIDVVKDLRQMISTPNQEVGPKNSTLLSRVQNLMGNKIRTDLEQFEYNFKITKVVDIRTILKVLMLPEPHLTCNTSGTLKMFKKYEVRIRLENRDLRLVLSSNCPIILYYMKLYVTQVLYGSVKIDDLVFEKLIKVINFLI